MGEADAGSGEAVEQVEGGERTAELALQLGETLPCGMSAHHVVAVDAVRRVLHAVVDFSPEHRQILSEPEHTDQFSESLNMFSPDSCQV